MPFNNPEVSHQALLKIAVDASHKQRVTSPTKGETMKFVDQAGKFLQDGAGRKRKPLRHNSLRAYRSDIEQHLAPFFGKMDLQDIDGNTVKRFVTYLSNLGLTGTTITRKVSLLKKILKSALDENGNQLYPANWSSDYLDMPELAPKRPTVREGEVSGAISGALNGGRANIACLYAILAGTGLRIAEALAIQVLPEDDGVSTIWFPEESRIVVRQQISRRGLAPTKTKAGQREVDLAPELNRFLRENLHK